MAKNHFGWPLTDRHATLPKWAQKQIHELECEKINASMMPDIRGAAKTILGGNCTFVDDDLSLLCCLAVSAIENNLHLGIASPQVVRDIETAKIERHRKQDNG